MAQAAICAAGCVLRAPVKNACADSAPGYPATSKVSICAAAVVNDAPTSAVDVHSIARAHRGLMEILPESYGRGGGRGLLLYAADAKIPNNSASLLGLGPIRPLRSTPNGLRE
jgi:hypothetical protein